MIIMRRSCIIREQYFTFENILTLNTGRHFIGYFLKLSLIEAKSIRLMSKLQGYTGHVQCDENVTVGYRVLGSPEVGLCVW